MARTPDIKRIRKEDFSDEYQSLIEKLSYSLNTFMDQVIFVLDKNIDFQNLNQQIITYTVGINSSGELVNAPDIRHGLRSKPAGVLCIKAQNINDPTIIPTSQPFINFDIKNSSTLIIKNISGLQNNSTYQLTLLIIGS